MNEWKSSFSSGNLGRPMSFATVVADLMLPEINWNPTSRPTYSG
jgi:hypothetical protein